MERPLRSLTARVAGSASRIPEPCTESASPRYLGEETGRTNGQARQATGVSRSEKSERPRASRACQLPPRNFTSHDCPEPLFRPRPGFEISSESQGRGRGGVSRSARTVGQTYQRCQMRAHPAVRCDNTHGERPDAARRVWAQGDPEKGSLPRDCRAATLRADCQAQRHKLDNTCAW